MYSYLAYEVNVYICIYVFNFTFGPIIVRYLNGETQGAYWRFKGHHVLYLHDSYGGIYCSANETPIFRKDSS